MPRAKAKAAKSRQPRNPVKREYAAAYGKWARGGRRGREPKAPAGLSFMGAQAVRMAHAKQLK